ncbi:MAG: hypothetical protein QM270_05700 [Bacillota bacterium]|nr:hypothetical protein [Bacillota bacterium]
MMIGKRYNARPLAADPSRTRALGRLDWLRVRDDESGGDVLGGRQQWFEEKYRRRRGCGPVAAANITAYLARQGQLVSLYLPYLETSRAAGYIDSDHVFEHGAFTQHMRAVWHHVTPGLLGLHSTQAFADGVHDYAREHGVGLDVEAYRVSLTHRRNRRSFRRLIQFVSEGLEADIPVAFLNHSAGQAREIESWHWVIITGIEVNHDESQAEVRVADAGVEKTFSLDRWFYTSRLGGGFVRFANPRSLYLATGG